MRGGTDDVDGSRGRASNRGDIQGPRGFTCAHIGSAIAIRTCLHWAWAGVWGRAVWARWIARSRRGAVKGYRRSLADRRSMCVHILVSDFVVESDGGRLRRMADRLAIGIRRRAERSPQQSDGGDGEISDWCMWLSRGGCCAVYRLGTGSAWRSRNGAVPYPSPLA